MEIVPASPSLDVGYREFKWKQIKEKQKARQCEESWHFEICRSKLVACKIRKNAKGKLATEKPNESSRKACQGTQRKLAERSLKESQQTGKLKERWLKDSLGKLTESLLKER